MMKRATQLAILATTLAAAGAWGQGIGTVKIGTNPEGPYFYVDGRQYTTTQVFLWPVGSKHQVQFPLSVDPASSESLAFQYGRNSNIRYTFSGWKANGGLELANSGATEQTVSRVQARLHLVRRSRHLRRARGEPRPGPVREDGTQQHQRRERHCEHQRRLREI